MKIIACDYHASSQHIVVVDEANGEPSCRRLAHRAWLLCFTTLPIRIIARLMTLKLPPNVSV